MLLVYSGVYRLFLPDSLYSLVAVSELFDGPFVINEGMIQLVWSVQGVSIGNRGTRKGIMVLLLSIGKGG